MTGTAESAWPHRGDPARVPFDHLGLDALMEADGLDAVLVTSKHNIQYLLGGYRFLLLSHDGCARPQPLPAHSDLYQARADQAAYVARPDGDLRGSTRQILGSDQTFRQ